MIDDIHAMLANPDDRTPAQMGLAVLPVLLSFFGLLGHLAKIGSRQEPTSTVKIDSSVANKTHPDYEHPVVYWIHSMSGSLDYLGSTLRNILTRFIEEIRAAGRTTRLRWEIADSFARKMRFHGTELFVSLPVMYPSRTSCRQVEYALMRATTPNMNTLHVPVESFLVKQRKRTAREPHDATPTNALQRRVLSRGFSNMRRKSVLQR